MKKHEVTPMTLGEKLIFLIPVIGITLTIIGIYSVIR